MDGRAPPFCSQLARDGRSDSGEASPTGRGGGEDQLVTDRPLGKGETREGREGREGVPPTSRPVGPAGDHLRGGGGPGAGRATSRSGEGSVGQGRDGGSGGREGDRAPRAGDQLVIEGRDGRSEGEGCPTSRSGTFGTDGEGDQLDRSDSRRTCDFHLRTGRVGREGWGGRQPVGPMEAYRGRWGREDAWKGLEERTLAGATGEATSWLGRGGRKRGALPWVRVRVAVMGRTFCDQLVHP